MSEERQLGAKLLRWSAGAAVIAAALGGCGGQADKPDHASSTTGTSRTGRPAQPASSITQDRLQDALLPGLPGLAAITTPQNGTYDSLPAADVASSAQQAPAGASIKPAKCKPAIWSGPDAAQFGKATATVTAFRKPGDTSPGGVQVWEELAASDGRSPQAALGTGPVSGCGTAKVSFKGSGLTFAEHKSPSLGMGSRGADLTPSSSNSRPTRLVTFVGKGYVGVVFAQGNVSWSQLDAFASSAYQTASQKLG
jgi:hypothetical protein